MFTILVAVMIGILFGFVIAWVIVPQFREWIERPKHTMLARERRFEEAARLGGDAKYRLRQPENPPPSR